MRFLYLLFIILPVVLLAQPTQWGGGRETAKNWQELTISDGLSQGMVYDLCQDTQGFIWVATKGGLNRYDGYNFTVFTHDPYNPYSLSDDNCSALLVDHRGRLWAGTLNQGLNLFDARTQRFYHIRISDRDVANGGNYEVRRLFEDPQGNIWVGTDKAKVFKITLPSALKTGYPARPDFTAQVQLFEQSFLLPGGSNDSEIGYIDFLPNGQAIVSAPGQVWSINWHQPITSTRLDWFETGYTPVQARKRSTRLDYWFDITVNNQLTGWYQGKRKRIALATNVVQITIIDGGTVAVATNELIWLMSPRQLYAHDSLSARNAYATIPPNIRAVTKLIKDRTGNLWVGTAGYGLRMFSPKIKQFAAYLPNTSINYLYQDRQKRTYVQYLWRYYQLDRSTNRLLPFLNHDVLFVMQDRQGFFWVSMGINRMGQPILGRYSTDWKLLNQYVLPPQTAFGRYLNQTVEDAQGNLWIGAINGQLLRFDPKTGTFRVFSYRHLLPPSGADIETSALYFDQAGTLWIGTIRGLIRADHPQTTPAFTLYKNSLTNRQSLSNDIISSMVDDPIQPANYLWVSTKGGWLERLDKATRQFTHFTDAQGLPNKVVYGILTDATNHLWLSTNRGLSRFDPKTQTFRNYTKADGLQDDEFNTGSFFKTPSGELLFGGVNGLTAFRPEGVGEGTGPAPEVHIIGLKVNNEPVTVGGADSLLTQSIGYTQRLDLSHRQNGLTLEFAVMDFTNAPKNQYRYWLEGVDQDWVQGGTNRFANYAQLPSGQYRFHVLGSVDGQRWSKPVVVAIWVHPPFYRTWWAYLLYAGLTVVIIWQLYRFQTDRLLLEQRVAFEQQEAGRLAELDALKTRFFTNISHEFRTPLTLILGPLTDLKHRLKTESVVTLTAPVVERMERNSTRLLTLINQLLDLSKLEAGQLKSEQEPGNLPLFFRTIGASFESLAQSRQIRFSVEQLETEWWGLFDRDKLEKIVTNLLSNAFKFTPAATADQGQEIRLKVQYPTHPEGGSIRFSVTDTGIGIAPDQLAHIFERFYQRSAHAGYVHTADGKINRNDGDAAIRPRKYEGTGIGLALVHELVRVLGGTITVNSAEGVGTSFRVTLPVVAVRETANLEMAESEVPFVGNLTGRLGVETLESEPTSENRLLIIDDNADIRAYVRSVFEGDYHILEATDGQEGLELATAELPDVVICDLMMPRMDGFAFCRTLKTGEATSHIPVIMLTAKATVEDRIEGFELGADDYLTKPFNQAELRVRVQNLIEGRQRLFRRMATGQRDLTPAADTTDATGGVLPVREQKFLDQLSAVVYQHLSDPEFTVERLAEEVGMSRTQINRKLKAVANQTPTFYIRDIRLARAAALLGEGEDNVTQVAFAVGFNHLSYFARVFQEHYGVLPSQYGKAAPAAKIVPDRA